ncbi:MAG: hypothetical protein ABMB14_34070, partial [Myxococcota bacterium]
MAAAAPFGPENDADRDRWQAKWADPGLAARLFAAEAAGRVVAFGWLAGTGSRSHLVIRARDGWTDHGLAAMIEAAVDHARCEGVAELRARLPSPLATAPVVSAISASGGREEPGRIEFRSRLDALPGEVSPSPIRWRAATDLPAAAALYAATCVDSPDGLAPGEDPAAAVTAWLSSRFTRSPADALH